MKKRESTVTRKTKETDIELALSLDEAGSVDVKTGLPFLDHMIEATACHGGIGMKLKASGDVHVDPHHLIEDIGIVLGSAISKAIDGSAGIQRAGFFLFPMDSSIASVALDICGRPNLIWNVEVGNDPIGGVDLKLFRDYYKAIADGLKATIHIQVPYRDNDHHALEAVAKAFGRALKEATKVTPDGKTLSTKGMIDD
jgi:imidazoleglycerol-phosphate dehydratase